MYGIYLAYSSAWGCASTGATEGAKSVAPASIRSLLLEILLLQTLRKSMHLSDVHVRHWKRVLVWMKLSLKGAEGTGRDHMENLHWTKYRELDVTKNTHRHGHGWPEDLGGLVGLPMACDGLRVRFAIVLRRLQL
jgi:hypothetical protein